MKPHQRDTLWVAFLLHRLSGLGLALFLPMHFMLLGQALHGEASLQSALNWTDHPFFKVAEFGLVFLLAVHMFGGLRVMAMEFFPWSGKQKTLAATAMAAAFAVATGFFLSAISQ